IARPDFPVPGPKVLRNQLGLGWRDPLAERGTRWRTDPPDVGHALDEHDKRPVGRLVESVDSQMLPRSGEVVILSPLGVVADATALPRDRLTIFAHRDDNSVARTRVDVITRGVNA